MRRRSTGACGERLRERIGGRARLDVPLPMHAQRFTVVARSASLLLGDVHRGDEGSPSFARTGCVCSASQSLRRPCAFQRLRSRGRPRRRRCDGARRRRSAFRGRAGAWRRHRRVLEHRALGVAIELDVAAAPATHVIRSRTCGAPDAPSQRRLDNPGGTRAPRRDELVDDRPVINMPTGNFARGSGDDFEPFVEGCLDVGIHGVS